MVDYLSPASTRLIKVIGDFRNIIRLLLFFFTADKEVHGIKTASESILVWSNMVLLHVA